MDIEGLVDAWRVNNVLNFELLNVCQDDVMELKPGKGKTIRSNFVHIIHVRRMWAEEKPSKEAAKIPKLEWKTASRKDLKQGLAISNEVLFLLFRKREASEKPVRFSNLRSSLIYAVAHEAHHR